MDEPLLHLPVPNGMNPARAIPFLLSLLLCIGTPAAGQNSASPEIPPPSAVNEETPQGELEQTLSRAQSSILFDQHNEDAWLSYYRAMRIAAYGERSREMDPREREGLSEILELMDKHVHGSYAWHVARYLHLEKADEGWNHLSEAAALRPNSPELFPDLLCMNQIRGRFDEAASYAHRIKRAKTFSSAEIEYNLNTLNSIERNGVLVTHGYVDTYPLYVLQYDKSIRRDVRIVSLEWLQSATYRKTVGEWLGVRPESLAGSTTEALQVIFRSDAAVPLYLSLTIPPSELRRYDSELYCTGLAMKRSATALGNLESLRENWENLFQRKHLTETEPLNRNYLIPLVLLHNHYKSLGKGVQADEIRSLTEKLSGLFGQTQKTTSYLR